MRQPVISHPPSGSKEMNAGADLPSSIFIQARTPTPEMATPAARVNFHTDMPKALSPG